MNFNYEENEKLMMQYIAECRKQITDTFFSEEELMTSNSLKDGLLKSGKISENTSASDTIKAHRNNMIDIKLNHTMRVVADVSKMADKMAMNIDFVKVVKISSLLHDIARFNQAVWSNDFNDRNCKQFNGMYHADYGYHILYVNQKIRDFKIPQNCHYAISQAVKYHQVANVTGDLAKRFKDIKQLDVNEYLTGSTELNEAEKIIVATLVQMVKDVDMLDILYQHLTGEFPVVRDFITYDVLNDTLSDISKYWGIGEEEIKRFNGLKDSNINNMKTIKIPSLNIVPSKLAIPADIQNRFFANDDMDLKELQNRRDWSFITGMWWRLNHFLNNINFTSNLEVVEENKLLEQIFSMYPDKYKPLVEPAFSFAKQELLDKRIIENKGKIYVEKSI